DQIKHKRFGACPVFRKTAGDAENLVAFLSQHFSQGKADSFGSTGNDVNFHHHSPLSNMISPATTVISTCASSNCSSLPLNRSRSNTVKSASKFSAILPLESSLQMAAALPVV